jgi:hypothetical protein
MAIRNDMTIDWSVSPRIITVASPSALLTCQDLYDTLRSLASQSDAIDDDNIVEGDGKKGLGPGKATGLTVTLLNAKVKFADRSGPGTVQCIIQDGTLATDDGSSPLEPSDYTHVVVMNQVGGVIATSSGDVEAISAGVWNRQESLILTPASIGLRIKTLLDAEVSSRATPGDPMSLTTLERSALALALWNIVDEIEPGISPGDALRFVASILCGKVSGGPDHPAFRGINTDTVRVQMTADANGNRTMVLVNP